MYRQTSSADRDHYSSSRLQKPASRDVSLPIGAFIRFISAGSYSHTYIHIYTPIYTHRRNFLHCVWRSRVCIYRVRSRWGGLTLSSRKGVECLETRTASAAPSSQATKRYTYSLRRSLKQKRATRVACLSKEKKGARFDVVDVDKTRV